MRFADIRTEWRVNDIERQMQQKAESHDVDSLRSNVDRLERSIGEASSCIDGLRFELEATLSRVEDLERRLEDLCPDVS